MCLYVCFDLRLLKIFLCFFWIFLYFFPHRQFLCHIFVATSLKNLLAGSTKGFCHLSVFFSECFSGISDGDIFGQKMILIQNIWTHKIMYDIKQHIFKFFLCL